MEDVIEFQEQFYILAKVSRAGSRGAVLQQGDMFAVFDLYGNIGTAGPSEEGLFYEGTRYLSRIRLRLNDRRPLLLSARVKDDNELFGADLTNPDLETGQEGFVIARDLVHLFRSRFLWDGARHEKIRLCNYAHTPLHLKLTFAYDADFADIFEVRGTRRSRRGSMLTPEVGAQHVRLGYRGLDDVERYTRIEWSEQPAELNDHQARFEYDLGPRQDICLPWVITCERTGRSHRQRTFSEAFEEATAALERTQDQYAEIEGSSERFNQWVRRSMADLRMLVAETPYGRYPYAGVPWFSTPFGRDGLITAIQLLWVNPSAARGVLTYLAATQADEFNEMQDAEPGKILHETRRSEMARLGEVPFGRYYGSVDATPLFVILAGLYVERTGDREFAEKLWPHVERALTWIDRCGDRDGDGFVEYARRATMGLVQQGWKDSQDSVFHADGSLAEPPIALCEVQGYVYDARLRAAYLADLLGHTARAGRLREQAETLRAAFEDQFWCEDQSMYALALDGRKRPCQVRTSNAGHCLFGGIASPDRARRVAEALLSQDMWSGWGVRTVSARARRYNPMSYHNGSVWPHDNGLIAAGMSRYRFDDAVIVPFSGLFEASLGVDSHRLPELICGFHRRPGEGPTLYPVACAPQAWSAGVVFQLIQACLRFTVDAERRRLTLYNPILPPFLRTLTVRKLSLPFGTVDLLFEQHAHNVGVTATHKGGEFEVRVIE
jgi:glycogen debranching enzyme